MGELRERAGILEHQGADRGAPEVWRRIAFTEAGAAVSMTQGDGCDVTLDDSGHLIFNLGGVLFTTPPDVAAKVNDALAIHVPAGKGKQVGEQVAQIQAQIDEKRRERQDVIAALDREIAEKRGILDGDGVPAAGRRPDAPVVP